MLSVLKSPDVRVRLQGQDKTLFALISGSELRLPVLLYCCHRVERGTAQAAGPSVDATQFRPR